MPPTRVLFVATTHFTLRAFLLPFARHFQARGWIVDGAAQGVAASPECRQAFARTIEIDWTRNPLQLRNFLAAPKALRRLVAEGGYDLVHVHTPVAAFVTRLALRHRRGAPAVIYTAHGFHFYAGAPPLKNALFLALEKLAGRWTDYLVTMNGEDRQAALRHRLVPPERVRYMPGIGIDLETYRPVPPAERGAVRREIGGEEAVVFLVVAECIPRKRHRDIFLAFSRLNDPRARLVLAGDGPLLPGLRALAGELGIGDRVRFLGFRTDMPALLCAADVLVLASAQEGLPRSIMEAFAYGVPCIGSDIRGIRDLLAPDAGLLFPLGDVDALAAAMARLAADPQEAARLGAAGRARIRDYELAKIVRLHEELYAEALGKVAAGADRKGTPSPSPSHQGRGA